jgi:hypothetical protein
LPPIPAARRRRIARLGDADSARSGRWMILIAADKSLGVPRLLDNQSG